MATLHASDGQTAPQETPPAQPPLESLLRALFGDHDLQGLWHFLAQDLNRDDLVRLGQGLPTSEAIAAVTAALEREALVDRGFFQRLEQRRPGSVAQIWMEANRRGVDYASPNFERRARHGLLARKAQFEGEPYVLRLSEGAEARAALHEKLLAQERRVTDGGGAGEPVFVTNPPGSGRSKFVVEYASYYRYDYDMIGFLVGFASRPCFSVDPARPLEGVKSPESSIRAERDQLALQLAEHYQSVWPLEQPRDIGPDVVMSARALVRRIETLRGLRVLLVVDDLVASESIHGLLDQVPANLHVVCVCAGAAGTVPASRQFRLDPLDVEASVAILLGESAPPSFLAPPLVEIAGRLGYEVMALNMASRVLRYCRPATLLTWLSSPGSDTVADAAQGEVVERVRLVMRVMRAQFGLAGESSSERHVWDLLCALTCIAPATPVGSSLLHAIVQRQDKTIKMLHLIRSLDGLARLGLTTQVDRLPCVSQVVQRAVRAEATREELTRARKATVEAMVDVALKRYLEFPPLVQPDEREADDPVLEHLVVGAQELVPEVLADPGRAAEHAGVLALVARLVERLSWADRDREAAIVVAAQPLHDLIRDVSAAAPSGAALVISMTLLQAQIARIEIERLLRPLRVQGTGAGGAPVDDLETCKRLAEELEQHPLVTGSDGETRDRARAALSVLLIQLGRALRLQEQNRASPAPWVSQAGAPAEQRASLWCFERGVHWSGHGLARDLFLYADLCALQGGVYGDLGRLADAESALRRAEEAYATPMSNVVPQGEVQPRSRAGYAMLCAEWMTHHWRITFQNLRVFEPDEGRQRAIGAAIDGVEAISKWGLSAEAVYRQRYPATHPYASNVASRRIRCVLEVMLYGLSVDGAPSEDAQARLSRAAGEVLQDARSLSELLSLKYERELREPSDAGRSGLNLAMAAYQLYARACVVYVLVTRLGGVLSVNDEDAALDRAQGAIGEVLTGDRMAAARWPDASRDASWWDSTLVQALRERDEDLCRGLLESLRVTLHTKVGGAPRLRDVRDWTLDVALSGLGRVNSYERSLR